MTDSGTLFACATLETVLDIHSSAFADARPGTCMKLAGLPLEDLKTLRSEVMQRHPGLLVAILTDGSFSCDGTVTATKLVELRNGGKIPVLALVPSALQTPAEDSYGSATFRELPMDGIAATIVGRLKTEMPPTTAPLVMAALDFARNATDEDKAKYLLAVREDGWKAGSAGLNLNLLGFIPDSSAGNGGIDWRNRLYWNKICSDILCDFQTFEPDRVARLPIRPDTNQHAIARLLMAGTERSRQGVMNAIRESADFSSLDFAAWSIPELDEAGGRKSIKITAGPLVSKQIATKDGDKTLFLGDGETASVRIRLTVTPPPKDCPELKLFRLLLVSTDSDQVVQEVRRVAVTSGGKPYRDINVKISAATFEEGTYYFRACGEDDAGNLLNREDDFSDVPVQEAWLAERRRNPDADHAAFKNRTGGKTVNETEDLVLSFVSTGDTGTDGTGDDGDGGKKDRKIRLDAAFQGYLRCRIGMMKRGEPTEFPSLDAAATGWSGEGGDGLRKDFILAFKGRESARIGVSAKLYALERELLGHGNAFGYLDCRTRRNPNHAVFDKIEFVEFRHPAFVELAEIRNRLFALIGASDGKDGGIFETWFEFCKPENLELVKRYVAGWKNALERATAALREGGPDAAAQLVALQMLDTIRVESPTDAARTCVVRLVPPIHPLRLAWFVDLLELFGEWEGKTLQNKSRLQDWTAQTAELFLGGLHPSSNPLAIAESQSRYGRYAGELAFGWGIWTRPDTAGECVALSDERQVKTHIAEHMNLPFGSRTDTDLDVGMIVRHFRNYLRRHPYADCLVVNVFNSGDGAAFVKALLELEGSLPGQRRYEFRLFGAGGRFGQGGAFRELTNPESTIAGEAESFSEAAANRLFPKLRFSVNSIPDFLADPHAFTANISFLVSPFATDIRLVPPDKKRPSDFLNGLVIRSQSTFSDKDGTPVWCKSVWCRESTATDTPRFFHEANALFNRCQTATAAVMNPQAGDVVPGTAVTVDAAGKSLISQIHACSDWVVTFDKSIGPDIFDARNESGNFPYLLDYIPGGEFSSVSSFLTARPGPEAYRFLDPFLDKAGLETFKEPQKRLRMLEDIRSISGSLLMQALATDKKAFEVIGLALTKRMLEKKGYLRDAFIVPIDLHKELFDDNGGDSRERADLLLVGMDGETRRIRIDVVEVKCRSSLQGEAVESLETKIKSQIDRTIATLRKHFGTDAGDSDGDRIDRALKNLELGTLLEFYIDRASRFGFMDEEARKRSLDFCASLADGYSLEFNPLEIIYNFTSPHGHRKELDGDVTRYTIGRQLVGAIMDADSDLDTIRLEETLRASRIDVPPPQTLPVPMVVATEPVLMPEPLSATKEEATPRPLVREPTDAPAAYDTLVGANGPTSQYGIIGIQKSNGRKVALDLSGTSTISLFGVQGAGKSYTIGTVAEMALKAIPHVNALAAPLSGVVFHYSESMDYVPEFTSMGQPNDNPSDVGRLLAQYNAVPESIDDIVLLVPKGKVSERKAQFPGIDVRPIAFKSSELGVRDWQFLLGAIGNDSMYIRQINSVMRKLRDNLSFDALRREVRNSAFLSHAQKTLAEQRFLFAQDYIDDMAELGLVLCPGRLVLVDLRDEFIQKDEALGLFVVMMNVFSGVGRDADRHFNKFIVFDEAHKYMGNRELTGNIVSAIREMRHKGVSLLIASQDPPSLPSEIIELSSIVLLHRFNSPEWLKHIRKSVTSLAHLRPADMAALATGEAYLWSDKSTDAQIRNRPIKIETRPRATKHGGDTVCAD